MAIPSWSVKRSTFHVCLALAPPPPQTWLARMAVRHAPLHSLLHIPVRVCGAVAGWGGEGGRGGGGRRRFCCVPAAGAVKLH